MTIILGAWVHSRDIQTNWRRVHPTVPLTVYDDDPKFGCLPPTWMDSNLEDLLLGMNSPHDRMKAAQRHHDLEAAEALVDPSVVLGENIDLASGVVVAPNVLLLRDVQLGLHSHINYGVSMTRCTVGAFTTISPGTTVCGEVTIGSCVSISAGVTIANCVDIADDVTIGAGAVILPFTRIGPGEKWLGVPARKVS